VTRPPDGAGDGSADVLRAVGSLLVALSGGRSDDLDRALDDVRASSGHAPGRGDYREDLPRYPAFGAERQRSRGDVADDIDFILSDARDRARQILDESMERARGLLRSEVRGTGSSAGIDPRAFDDLRRTTRGIVTEVRDVQRRLARIEGLLRDTGLRPQTPPVAASSAPPREYVAQAEQYTPPPAAPEATPPSNAPAPPPAYAPEFERPDEPRSDIAPAPAPPRAPFSVVPPQRREWTEPEAASPPAPAAEYASTEYAPEPPPPAYPLARAVGDPELTAPPLEDPYPPAPAIEMPYDELEGFGYASPAHLATFLPEDGAITLRVSPVAGFQGLMRVQDALARLPAVRHASVQAYSQGEARLRLELAAAAGSDELADALGRALQEPARTVEASEDRRELHITLR
jgi:hypothetical protein